MKHSLKIFFFAALFCGVACNQTKTGEASQTDSTPAPRANQAQEENFLQDALPIVYMETKEFVDKIKPGNKTLVFKQLYANKNGNGVLSLAGWVSKNNGSGGQNDFGAQPDLIFLVGGPGTFKLKEGLFIGDITIPNQTAKNLYDYLTNRSEKYVLFVPQIDTANPAHYWYNIQLDN